MSGGKEIASSRQRASRRRAVASNRRDCSGQADAEMSWHVSGSRIGPSVPIATAGRLRCPVKLGLSLKDYYELSGETKFGYGSAESAHLAVRPRDANLHGGVDSTDSAMH